MSLKEQLFEYCKQTGLGIQRSEIKSLDYEIFDDETFIGVMVRDWNRALGYDAIIRAERIKKEYHEFTEVIILTNSCSEQAEVLAKKIKVPIFKHWQQIKMK